MIKRVYTDKQGKIIAILNQAKGIELTINDNDLSVIDLDGEKVPDIAIGKKLTKEQRTHTIKEKNK